MYFLLSVLHLVFLIVSSSRDNSTITKAKKYLSLHEEYGAHNDVDLFQKIALKAVTHHPTKFLFIDMLKCMDCL